MPSDLKQIALSIFTTLVAACSSTPPSAPQTPAAAGNAPASAPGRASGAAAAPAGVVDSSLVRAGYSVMRRHGEVLYCRNEVITGQRIETRICLSAAQLQDET